MLLLLFSLQHILPLFSTLFLVLLVHELVHEELIEVAVLPLRDQLRFESALFHLCVLHDLVQHLVLLLLVL